MLDVQACYLLCRLFGVSLKFLFFFLPWGGGKGGGGGEREGEGGGGGGGVGRVGKREEEGGGGGGGGRHQYISLMLEPQETDFCKSFSPYDLNWDESFIRPASS